MRWLAVLTASSAVHAAVLAAMPARSDDRLLAPRAAPAPAPPLELASADPIVVDVVTLPPRGAGAPEVAPRGAGAREVTSDLTEIEAARPADRDPAHRGAGAPEVEATRGAGAREVEDPRGAGAREGGAGWMTMRGAGRGAAVGLGLAGVSGETMARILADEGPGPAPRSGELHARRDHPDGGYTGHDLVFDADVDADGHVSAIRDRPNVRVKVNVPRPRQIARGAGDHLASWSKDPYGVSTGTGKATEQRGGNDKEEGRTYTILGGSFDATDALMRLAGQDPYDARKRAFLDRTFDERVELGRAHRARAYAQSDRAVLAHLDRLWARDDLDLAARKQAVFELWDDCAEPGPGVEDALAEAGERARAAVIRFVRVHLPAGSDRAYTAGELATLDARRRSRARFTPYD